MENIFKNILLLEKKREEWWMGFAMFFECLVASDINIMKGLIVRRLRVWGLKHWKRGNFGRTPELTLNNEKLSLLKSFDLFWFLSST